MVKTNSKLAGAGRIFRNIRRSTGLYILLLPAVVLTVLFAYKPMYGIIIAFKDFRPIKGIIGSSWANPWYKYFEQFFTSNYFGVTLKNTLVITIYNLVINFPLPIILALFINRMQARRFRRVYQTITYMPHFISTVVMCGLILMFLTPSSGLLGNLFRAFGGELPNLIGKPEWFSSIYVWSDVWQHTGWNSIIYLAALSSVDVSLYEAATVDGATRWQKMIYIDIPMLIPTAMILLVLSVGGLMNLGFEKVYALQNDLNRPLSEVIATYVYRVGITNIQYSYSSAIGLFNTIVNFILLVSMNKISKVLTENSLW